MKAQPAAFLTPFLPLDLSIIPDIDSGRYHSIWLVDHMVSFWPESIWTPEFTDLATVSHSPHRHLDAMAVAGAAAVLTKNVPIITSVVDTVRRHPAMLAQTALTLDHLSKGRFILGVGSGETENIVPYGFDFAKPVSRFEESLKVIRLLWDTDGPVDFEGAFYKLHHARLDTEPYDGRTPKIWIGANGPRMLEITGRYADGWWPAGAWVPEEYAEKLQAVRQSADRAGRDPMAIVPAAIQMCLLANDEGELAQILDAPLVKAWVLQPSAEVLRKFGFRHPLGDSWRGYGVPEANLRGDELASDWNGNFELFIGGPKRGPNWLPTTPETSKVFIRQGFDKWSEQPAILRIERVGMDTPRPLPTPETMITAIEWAGRFMTGLMNDWPDQPYLYTNAHYLDYINQFPPMPADPAIVDKRRGRAVANMSWILKPDEAMIIEFDSPQALWNITNMGPFFVSMDFLYRQVGYTKSRTKVDSDGKVRLMMTHDDCGYHNWLDTQGFERGNITFRLLMSEERTELHTRVLKRADLAAALPADSARVTREGRVQQLHERFDGVRRRFVL